MTKKHVTLFAVAVAAAIVLAAQQPDILGVIRGGQTTVIALPDFRGAGDAQQLMGAFNQTLYSELENSGILKVAPKSMYPLQVPQQPQEFKPPLASKTPPRRGQPPPPPIRQGPWLTDWSGPPVNARYLAFGYTAVQNDRMVLFGWLYDVSQPDLANAQVIGKLYFGSIDESGARKIAQEFAADILARFGAKSLAGSRIYFVSNRSGNKEIWSMDYDGSNQKAFTAYASITTMPQISPDNTKIGFTTFARGGPSIMIHSLETGRRLTFVNPVASVNATPDFTLDGKQVVFASKFGGDFTNLYIANIDGGGLRRLTSARAVEVEPKINPKTGNEIVFTSGRSGPAQIYRMSMDGADIQRLTTGEGDAANPSWHPDGQLIAFAWTRGFEPGNYNIFVMNVATRDILQLTHGVGKNENPSWAPDGRHIVFSSTRARSTQIWTMLADGTQPQQLTTQGQNEKPVWTR